MEPPKVNAGYVTATLSVTLPFASICVKPELPIPVSQLLTDFHLAPIFQKLALKDHYRPKCCSTYYLYEKEINDVIILIME